MCPSGDNRSNWSTIGCKRGALRSHMPSLSMCPQADPEIIFYGPGLPELLSSPSRTKEELGHEDANRILSKITVGRGIFLRSRIPGSLDTFITAFDPIRPAPHPQSVDFREKIALGTRHHAFEKRILEIIYSVHESSTSKSLFGSYLENIIFTLRASGIFEVESNRGRGIWPQKLDEADNVGLVLVRMRLHTDNLKQDALIAKSHCCLRTALETMQVISQGYMSRATHESCGSSFCKVHCISNIAFHLDDFLDELSRVLFSKQNRMQKSQWLSIFYSLCIQSYVRRVLVHLSGKGNGFPEVSAKRASRFEQYLHLGLRLFTAASGSYDPLMQDYSSISEELATDEKLIAKLYQDAQLSVKQASWKERKINNSYDYLKESFEDAGGHLGENPYSETDSGMPPPLKRTLIDGIANPPLGSFQCTYPGCVAQPFQTQVNLFYSQLLVKS
jgi:hypothetical protein